MAEAGARVVVNGRSPETVRSAVEEIRKAGGLADSAVFDVSDSKAVAEAVSGIKAQVGPIDVLVNNAGIHRRAPLEQMTDDEWQAVIGGNLSSVFYVSRAVAPTMIQRGGGTIINISSLNSIGSRPTIANYCAAKGGLNALTRSMATEWGRHGIRANGIAPGYFETDLNRSLVDDPEFDRWVRGEVPLGRWGDPKELIGAALFLASRASSYVNGHVLVVDGGWTACL